MATEHSLFTWDPVTQAWVHERGPEIAPPPPPPDLHALQSYFFDEDSKQWIRTVLAPMGRELAAKWQGAHKIPDDAIARPKGAVPAKDAKKKGGSPVGVIALAVVLLVALGGVGVVASQNGVLSQVAATAPSASPSAAASAAASIAPSPSAEPSASPSPSAAGGGGGGGGGGGAVRTPTPQGAVVTQPPGSSQLHMADGTNVYYTGPTLVLRNTQLAAQLLVANAQGRAATGVITVILGDQRGSTQAAGTIDAAGHVVIQVLASQPSGQYPLSVLYNNQLGQVALITVR